MENFEEILRKDLHQFLQSMKEVDERLPECPDVEDKWEEIAKAYIPDGIREFQDYPSASIWNVFCHNLVLAENSCKIMHHIIVGNIRINKINFFILINCVTIFS